MAWLEEQIKTKGQKIGEWEAGEKLTEFRSLERYFACVCSATQGRGQGADPFLIEDWLMRISAPLDPMEVGIRSKTPLQLD
jgi:hypothetical protein